MQMLLERHAGVVPDSFEALEALPGVGHKTASVVMAQAFGWVCFSLCSASVSVPPVPFLLWPTRSGSFHLALLESIKVCYLRLCVLVLSCSLGCRLLGIENT